MLRIRFYPAAYNPHNSVILAVYIDNKNSIVKQQIFVRENFAFHIKYESDIWKVWNQLKKIADPIY